LLAFLPLAAAWSCDAVPAASGSLDLSALGGVKEATKETETPPTKNTARVRFDICGKLPKEDGAKDEDQVGVAEREPAGGERAAPEWRRSGGRRRQRACILSYAGPVELRMASRRRRGEA
jgi:hypothetical protein